MLQIIGWLGCLYLIVKALSVAGSNDSYSPSKLDPEKMEMNSAAGLACSIAWVGAVGFGIWLAMQGAAVAETVAVGQSAAVSYSDCLRTAPTPEEATACLDLLP